MFATECRALAYSFVSLSGRAGGFVGFYASDLRRFASYLPLVVATAVVGTCVLVARCLTEPKDLTLKDYMTDADDLPMMIPSRLEVSECIKEEDKETVDAEKELDANHC